MKMTVDIADPLFRKAKKKAASEGTTLRDLVERGLLHVVTDKPKKRPAFKLVTFEGNGLQPEFADGDWDRIRDAIYEGRGG